MKFNQWCSLHLDLVTEKSRKFNGLTRVYSACFVAINALKTDGPKRICQFKNGAQGAKKAEYDPGFFIVLVLV